VLFAHDEKQNRALELLGFVELEFRDGEFAGVAFRTRRRLTVFVTDDPNVGRRVPYHLERGIDYIHIRFC